MGASVPFAQETSGSRRPRPRAIEKTARPPQWGLVGARHPRARSVFPHRAPALARGGGPVRQDHAPGSDRAHRGEPASRRHARHHAGGTVGAGSLDVRRADPRPEARPRHPRHPGHPAAPPHGLAHPASLLPSHRHSHHFRRGPSQARRGREYYQYKRRCIYCDIIRQELADRERVVHETEQFVVVVPYASRAPFETWILPRQHAAAYEDALSGDLVADLARVLGGCFRTFTALWGIPPSRWHCTTPPIGPPR